MSWKSSFLCDLADVSGSKVDPRFLTLTEIETFAKQFYGFTERLERKLAKDQKQATLFAKTAHQARARWYKSRANGRSKEIERMAEAWSIFVMRMSYIATRRYRSARRRWVRVNDGGAVKGHPEIRPVID